MQVDNLGRQCRQVMLIGNVGRQHRQVMQVDNEGRYVGKQCRYVDNVGDDERMS